MAQLINGEIVLTQEEKDAMQGKDRLDVDSIMNWVIWGNPDGNMNQKTMTKEIVKRDVPTLSEIYSDTDALAKQSKLNIILNAEPKA